VPVILTTSGSIESRPSHPSPGSVNHRATSAGQLESTRCQAASSRAVAVFPCLPDKLPRHAVTAVRLPAFTQPTVRDRLPRLAHGFRESVRSSARGMSRKVDRSLDDGAAPIAFGAFRRSVR
jgi:hypothetical protein